MFSSCVVMIIFLLQVCVNSLSIRHRPCLLRNIQMSTEILPLSERVYDQYERKNPLIFAYDKTKELKSMIVAGLFLLNRLSVIDFKIFFDRCFSC